MDQKDYQITNVIHRILASYIHSGDTCIDATCGNGTDTIFLAEKTGEKGIVYGFDIQSKAVEKTDRRIKAAGYRDRVLLFQTGHENMKDVLLVQEPDISGTIAAAVFNFGYLPGGDHRIHTCGETSLAAVTQCETLLAVGGIMALCLYSGGDASYRERKMILSHLRELDQKSWLVIVMEYYNRRNDPPLPVFVIKQRQEER